MVIKIQPQNLNVGPTFKFCGSILIVIQSANLVPRAFSSFKMAVRETPDQGCQNGSKNSLEFCHVNTLKCLRFVWTTVSDCKKTNKQTGPPDAKTNLRKSHFIMCHFTKYSTILGVFQQPWLGVSPTAILSEVKALGTTLPKCYSL